MSLKPLQFTSLPMIQNQPKKLGDLRSRTLKLMPKQLSKASSVLAFHETSQIYNQTPIKKKAIFRRANASLTKTPVRVSYNAIPDKRSLEELEREFSLKIKSLQESADFEYFTKIFRITSMVFQRIIDMDTVFAGLLAQIKSNYEMYQDLLLRKMNDNIKSYEYRENQFKTAIELLKTEGVPVEEICTQRIPEWNSLYRKVPSLKLPKQDAVNGFHQEFMSNAPEFSESWRNLIKSNELSDT